MSAANATPTTSRSRRDRFRSSRFRSVRLETASSAPPLRRRRAGRRGRLRSGPAGPRELRHPLRRRGQPARRPPRRRDPRLGRERRQHRRARRHQHLPPRQLHPHRHDEPRGGRSAPQLRDRFALRATVEGCREIDDRVEIIDRALEADGGAGGAPNPRTEYASEVETLRDDLVAARERLSSVGLPTDFKAEIAELCLEAGSTATAATWRRLEPP